MESISILTVKYLLIWIDEQSWCINEYGLWNNIFNSGGESGIETDSMIEFFLDNNTE